MKWFTSVFLVACLANPWAAAQSLTAAERQRAIDHLMMTSAEFLRATEGLSLAQSHFKPKPESWSVAEVSEHVASAEDFLIRLVQGQVMVAPSRSEPVNLSELDEFVLTVIRDRTKKVAASQPLIPNNRFGSVEASRDHFIESRAKTLAFLKQTPDLRDHAIDSPLGQKLDAYQWLLFISAHSERHTQQIVEVKADVNFPKD